MKKIIVVLALSILLLGACIAKEKDGQNPQNTTSNTTLVALYAPASEYEYITIRSDQYTFSENFDQITAAGFKVKVGYKKRVLDEQSSTIGFTDLVYVLSGPEKDIRIGQLSASSGFVDAFGKNLSDEEDFMKGSTFISKKFKGFPIETLENPFFLTGLAVDDDGVLYTTEVLIRLEIDLGKLTLIKHEVKH